MKILSILMLLLVNVQMISAAEYTEALGHYNDGKLKNGESILSRGENIHKLFKSRKRQFGTKELIDAIMDLADESTSRFTNFEKIQVGDLSDVDGGSAKPAHVSHQNGLDVDIVYFPRKNKLQSKDAGYWEEWFVKGGKVTDNFNTYRNWEMFKFLVKRGDVSRILVDTAIKKEICHFASIMGEKNKYKNVLRRIRPSSKHHKTHFHLRLKCPAGDNRCQSQHEPPAGHGCDKM